MFLSLGVECGEFPLGVGAGHAVFQQSYIRSTESSLETERDDICPCSIKKLFMDLPVLPDLMACWGFS